MASRTGVRPSPSSSQSRSSWIGAPGAIATLTMSSRIA